MRFKEEQPTHAKPETNPGRPLDLAGGEPAALDTVTLTGEEPQLPSSFRVAAAAQTSIAATGLAAAEIWKLRSGQDQKIAVTCVTPSSMPERALSARRTSSAATGLDAIAGVYKTHGQRFVRLHTNSPHHRDAVCRVLNCKAERDEVQAALCNGMPRRSRPRPIRPVAWLLMRLRSYDEWSGTPQAEALEPCRLSLSRNRRRRAEAFPKTWPTGNRPLAGLRVLDPVARDRWPRRRTHPGRAWRRRAAVSGMISLRSPG